MVDLQLLRKDPEKYKQAAQQKGYGVDIDRLLELDKQKRQLQIEAESLRKERNEIANTAKNSKPTENQIIKGRELKQELSKKEQTLNSIEEEFTKLYKEVPNLSYEDVPVGSSEDQNQVVKEWGVKPVFDFKPKNHWEIAEAKDLIDKERAAKITGSRFAYIKGGLVQLQFAIIQYVLDTLTDQKIIEKIIDNNNLKLKSNIFIPILPPVMIREEMYDQMDRLEPREDRYHIDGDDDNLWLIGSAEHTLGSMYSGEILPEKMLPIRYIGYSTSFRQEAGTYGKDSEGIIRMHQFDKLEMETFSTPETSFDEHKLMIAIQEYMMQQLELSYQVLHKCTADIGKPNARGVDIEVWLPGQNKYRETHTADYMTDYQSRRMQTRTRRQDGQIELIHTNDATAFALGRTLVAIMENYQQKNGGVRIPKILQRYLGGRENI
jgi:seryl-tRNA synthetase